MEVDLCRDQAVTAFPSVRVYRHGSDDVVVSGVASCSPLLFLSLFLGGCGLWGGGRGQRSV